MLGASNDRQRFLLVWNLFESKSGNSGSAMLVKPVARRNDFQWPHDWGGRHAINPACRQGS